MFDKDYKEEFLNKVLILFKSFVGKNITPHTIHTMKFFTDSLVRDYWEYTGNIVQLYFGRYYATSGIEIIGNKINSPQYRKSCNYIKYGTDGDRWILNGDSDYEVIFHEPKKIDLKFVATLQH